MSPRAEARLFWKVSLIYNQKSCLSDLDVYENDTYLEATSKFIPGWFSCQVVWETHFTLHPRLKTGPGKPGLSRGFSALRLVLNKFAVTNRKNMFVYQDNSGNVFYLRYFYVFFLFLCLIFMRNAQN